MALLNGNTIDITGYDATLSFLKIMADFGDVWKVESEIAEKFSKVGLELDLDPNKEDLADLLNFALTSGLVNVKFRQMLARDREFGGEKAVNFVRPFFKLTTKGWKILLDTCVQS